MKDPTDNLTPLARRILSLDADKAYEKLVIGHGDGNPRALADLTSAGPRDLCSKFVTKENEAKAMLAGLWLWQDYLDESHEVCQALETPSGSWWHAILHPREGDFGNAKYWYAKVGNHPAMAAVGQNAAGLLRDEPADIALLKVFHNGFSGPAFVDLVQRVYDKNDEKYRRTAIALQQLEFRILFEWNAATAQA